MMRLWVYAEQRDLPIAYVYGKYDQYADYMWYVI